RKNYGIRRLLEKVPAVRLLCQKPQLRALIEPILGTNAFAVRGIFFDKTPTANWGVYWHQDLTIAVKKRIDTAGFSPWSVKEGINCVQPTIAILERMLTLRVHLDDVHTNNGPLSVIPGSHRQGIWQQKTIETVKNTPVNCLVKSGGVVVMRPLLIHSSRSALKPNRRRVIHLEFAAEKLPNGLEWYEKYPIFANS
ncbi:MAG: phytanoyl-CoA dioxygenase family protein, partial [Okeania sp. SIO2H7]|nr:phytanoyl-CoA dioxygenase family protein [Okeania sp. SIO2H7]